MSEAEWFASTDPRALARFIHGRVNRLRFREMAGRWIEMCGERRWADRVQLFARYSLWLQGGISHPRADDTTSLAVLDAGASYSAGEYETNAAIDRLVWDDDPVSAAALAGAATIDLRSRIQAPHGTAEIHAAQSRKDETERQFCTEFRDIAGNPFRRVAWQPEWCSETAVALARGIEAERAIDRMPILADALEEAGCGEPQVLQHCRHEPVHVRGCWVIDIVLGRVL
jgi:hypothetical protein